MTNTETATVLPQVLNGYPVVRTERHANCVTVMVRKDDEFVVATWWPELKTTWMWGHYFRFLGDEATAKNKAAAEFNDVAERNARR